MNCPIVRSDLALLKITNGADAIETPAVRIAEHVASTGNVEILQFDETSQLQRGKAQIINVSLSELPTAPYPALIFSLLTDLNVNGEGAVAVCDGKIAGLIVSYDPGSRVGHMLPYLMLRHFLNDALKPPYKGFATAGVTWTSLIDPAKREYLGVKQNGKGILVLSCLPGTGSAETLKPNDVILAWDGNSIDNLGFYDDPDFGRLGFANLIKGKHEPGDVVPLVIVRDGTEKTVNVRLDRWLDSAALIPEDVTGEQAEYLVEGGLIIREVTGRYLKSHGPDWQQEVDSRLVHLYLTQRYSPSQPDEHVVILSGVLPASINIGYQNHQDMIITGLNGKPVRNMSDVFRHRGRRHEHKTCFIEVLRRGYRAGSERACGCKYENCGTLSSSRPPLSTKATLRNHTGKTINSVPVCDHSQIGLALRHRLNISFTANRDLRKEHEHATCRQYTERIDQHHTAHHAAAPRN